MLFRAALVSIAGITCQMLAIADDSASTDIPVLTIRNDTEQKVALWLRSEKDTRPDPWTNQSVEPQKEAKFTLERPDPYILIVEMGDQRSRAKPAAIKSFLQSHPKTAMQIRVSAAMSNLAEFLEVSQSSSDLKIGRSILYVKASTEDAATLRFEFMPEPQCK